MAHRRASASVLKEKEKERRMFKPAKIVTACIVVIGNEILSGRTKDANLNFLALELNKLVDSVFTDDYFCGYFHSRAQVAEVFRLKRDWRPCSHGKTTAVAETAEHPPTPFGRGMPPRRRGRIAETSGESIYQRIALARTFYPRRRRRRSRPAGLPPDSSATALKTAPTTL